MKYDEIAQNLPIFVTKTSPICEDDSPRYRRKPPANNSIICQLMADIDIILSNFLLLIPMHVLMADKDIILPNSLYLIPTHEAVD